MDNMGSLLRGAGVIAATMMAEHSNTTTPTSPTTTTTSAAAAAAMNAAATASSASGAAATVGADAPPPFDPVQSLLPILGLGAFAPLYGLAGSYMGGGPTKFLVAAGVFWGVYRVCRHVYGALWGFVYEHFMCRIHVGSDDEIYRHLMKWLAQQPRMADSKALMAESVSRTAWDDDEELAVAARDRSGVYLNFSNQEARSNLPLADVGDGPLGFIPYVYQKPPRFVPAVGLHDFWWQGRYFKLHRKQESLINEGAGRFGSAFKDKECLVISCLGRSPEPIKQLLSHAKQEYYNDHRAKTIVKRPAAKYWRHLGGRYSWEKVANRPVRDMRTVVLDEEQKLAVLGDMNEYLHPLTPRWYSNRGIPLRRGYLFHGPPGCGKTSLSFALAGTFGLDIHVVSLLDPSLTEEDLNALLGSLPRRCIVLLEDIDTAGLKRPDEEKDKDKNRDKDNHDDKKEEKGKGGGKDAKADDKLKDASSDHQGARVNGDCASQDEAAKDPREPLMNGSTVNGQVATGNAETSPEGGEIVSAKGARSDTPADTTTKTATGDDKTAARIPAMEDEKEIKAQWMKNQDLFSQLAVLAIAFLTKAVNNKSKSDDDDDSSSSSSSSSRSSSSGSDDKKSARSKSSNKSKKKTKGDGSGDSETKGGITLSGLLNAVDGVASHEGRVLIMTTNRPEDLDEALIRPGRVDLQVGFANATRRQAEELFVRMYEADAVAGRDEEKEREADAENSGRVEGGEAERRLEGDDGDDGGDDVGESADAAAVSPAKAAPVETVSATETAAAETVVVSVVVPPTLSASEPVSPAISPDTNGKDDKPTTTGNTTAVTIASAPSTPSTAEQPATAKTTVATTTAATKTTETVGAKAAAAAAAAAAPPSPPLTPLISAASPGASTPAPAPGPPGAAGDLDIPLSRLPEVAARFAAKIPEGAFSPAEIQGYLLKRKKHPGRALEQADEWVDSLVRQKASRSKIAQVQ